jgi:hypothetical protein
LSQEECEDAELILFKDRTEVTRLIGFRPREALIEALSPYIE